MALVKAHLSYIASRLFWLNMRLFFKSLTIKKNPYFPLFWKFMIHSFKEIAKQIKKITDPC